jgi:TetR/AcrR family transcriptional repressor of mexJK operon
MTPNKNIRSLKSESKSQILIAAARLFARLGFNSVSTREIAAEAAVSEVTIYRHFPKKRELCLAVLDAELSQVQISGDQLRRIATAQDAEAVLGRVFDAVQVCLTQRKDLIRLLQYGVLEMGAEGEKIIRKHLSELVRVIASYLQPWQDRGLIRGSEALPLVLAIAAIVLGQGQLQRLFSGESSGPGTLVASYLSAVTVKESKAG